MCSAWSRRRAKDFSKGEYPRGACRSSAIPRLSKDAPGFQTGNASPAMMASADLVLAYVGFLNWSRGLEFVLRALASYVRREARVRLRLIGKGNAEVALRNLTAELGLSDYVEFLGWVDHSQIVAISWHRMSVWFLTTRVAIGTAQSRTNCSTTCLSAFRYSRPSEAHGSHYRRGTLWRGIPRRDTQSFISCLDRLRNPVYRRTWA